MKSIGSILVIFSTITVIFSMVTLNGYGLSLKVLSLREPSEPHPANALWLEPSTIDLAGAGFGERFNITAWVNVTDTAYTWQTKLLFDPTYFEVTRMDYTGYGKSDFFTGHTTMPVAPTIDNTAGYVLHGETLLGEDDETGHGSLIWVEFNLKQIPPDSHLTMNFSIDYSLVLDPFLEDILLDTIDGTDVVVALIPTSHMFVYPAIIKNSELGPSSQFTITINVSDVPDLYTWQIMLWFDPTILECTDAYYPSGHVFDGLTYVPVEPEIDNVAGYVLHGCTLLLEPVDVDQGVLCALEFHILDRGSCDLALDQGDCFLLDDDLNDTQTTLANGFFDNREVVEMHDIAVTNVVPSSTLVIVGESITINVMVENEGDFAETFDVIMYYDWSGNSVDTITGVALNPDESDTLSFIWDTTGIAVGTYVMRANATVVAGEEDTADNSYVDGTVEVIESPPPPTENALWIEPSMLVLTSAGVGERFNLTLWINLTEPSYAWLIKVLFDPTYFQAIRTDYTGEGKSEFFTGHTTIPVAPQIDNTEGHVLHGESLLGDDYRESGCASLCWIEFETIALPPESLTINFSDIDTLVWNQDLDHVPIENIHGTEVHVLPVVEVHDVAVVDVVPSATSVVAGQSVIIDVTVENQGNFTETSDVTAYYAEITIGAVTTTLDVSEVDVVSLVWDTTGVAAGTYAISAEASVVPGEMDVADNFLQDGIVQVLEPPPYIPIAVNIHPETLNLKSKGRWITCVIELPEGYSARDIDISTIMLNNIIPVAKSRCRLMVKFDRAEVISYIRDVHGIKFGNVQLTVTGELYNGIIFEGSDTIRARMPGDADCNGKVNVRDVALVARRFGQHQYDLECDLNEDGKTDFRDIVIAVMNFGKTY